MKIQDLTYDGVFIKTVDLTTKHKIVIESNFKNAYQGKWKDLFAYKYLNLYNSKDSGLCVIGYNFLNHTDTIISPSFLIPPFKNKLK